MDDHHTNGFNCSWQGILTFMPRWQTSYPVSDVKFSYNNLLYWFWELDEYLKEVGKHDVLQDPTCIYNADESGFPLVPKSKKVIALKTDKHVYQGGATSNKMQITVLIAASANGHCEATCLSRCSTTNSVVGRFSSRISRWSLW